MSALLEIKRELDVAAKRVASLEESLCEHPDLPSIAANLETAVRMRERLELAFLDVAADVGIEVCKYRAFNDKESRPIAGAAFAAIAGFQKLFSVVYSALDTGNKKTRATVSSDESRKSSFGFGYGFTGSVGVVLTLRRDEYLFTDSNLEASMHTISEMAKAKTPSEVLAFAQELGAGAVNALYRWAQDSESNGLGADIEWFSGREVKAKLFIQRQQLARLRNTINETSSEASTEIVAEGILTMADARKARFSFERDGMPVITGRVESGAIDDDHVAAVPSRYTAVIRRTLTTRFATGDQKISYHLTKLRKRKANDAAQ